ncbi:glyoxalase superfamily protein [Pseudogemmobacter bohemicus]|uniref:glyoxalase superfamily protein n=1 Tax=Pseudogemmobacter bohemicus TaxID=2250708 RepID=UPI000DD459B9|nr:glyoxalase superfamily protein [Pseudogemmobacter bohemicus]
MGQVPTHIPTIDQARAQAKARRAGLAQQGQEVSHSAALELVAKAHGFRDWNTLHARAGNRPQPPVRVGDITAGRYLGQEFLAEVIGITALSETRYEVELQLDQAVDVVTFDSFSNYRSRIRKVVDASGRSFDRTSDGMPHLTLSAP